MCNNNCKVCFDSKPRIGDVIIPQQMVGAAKTEAKRITVTCDNNDIFMVHILLHYHLKNMYVPLWKDLTLIEPP